MTRNECYAKTVELLAQRRTDAKLMQQRRRSEALAKIPDLAEIERGMALASADFFELLAEGKVTDENFAEIKKRSLDLQRERAERLYENGYSVDALELKYACPICSDEGFTRDGMCKCFKKALSQAYLEASHLKEIYKKQSFKNYDLSFFSETEKPNAELILSFCKRYVKSFEKDGKNLLFIGVPGCGKTYLSCAIGTALIEEGVFVIYTPVQQLISDFEAEKFGKPGGSDTSVYKDCDLLIIDDVGSEMQTSFSDSVLYTVINDRINLRKPMIISTNYTGGEIEQMYDDRLASRLFYEFTKIPFPKKDIRREKEARAAKKSV